MRAAEKHNIQLTWDGNIIGVLANGYDVHYGARSIKYEVERRVVNKLASAHENQLLFPGSRVHVVLSDDGEDYKFTNIDQVIKDESSEGKVDSAKNTDQTQDAEFVEIAEPKLKLLIENPPSSNGKGKNMFFNITR